uniref:Uncharacterized protein n=1 Tax=Nothobranchius furzeri TaxID=105023 RepID=A0A1A8U042_NOTFU
MGRGLCSSGFVQDIRNSSQVFQRDVINHSLLNHSCTIDNLIKQHKPDRVTCEKTARGLSLGVESSRDPNMGTNLDSDSLCHKNENVEVRLEKEMKYERLEPDKKPS